MLANILNTIAYGFLLLALLIVGLTILKPQNPSKTRWQLIFLFATSGLALLIITIWLT